MDAGEGAGAVKKVYVTDGCRREARCGRREAVMDSLELGLIIRIEIIVGVDVDAEMDEVDGEVDVNDIPRVG